jgi:hypothetical protein
MGPGQGQEPRQCFVVALAPPTNPLILLSELTLQPHNPHLLSGWLGLDNLFLTLAICNLLFSRNPNLIFLLPGKLEFQLYLWFRWEMFKVMT